MTPNASSFGAEVRRLRELRELTATQLGNALATSSTTINEIECGLRFPRHSLVFHLAKALNTDGNRLLDLRDAAKAAAEQAKHEERAQQARQCPEEPPSDPRLGLGWLLRRARTQQGLSVASVEKRCGMSSGYLRQVERGDVYPADAWLRTLSDVLGVGFAELQQLRDLARAANMARLQLRKQARAAQRSEGVRP